MIETNKFITQLKQVFGADLKLPIAVWRSDSPLGKIADPPHCIFAALPQIESGETLSFTKEKLHCGGGRLYCGFSAPNPGIPRFVSLREKYKQTPEMVSQYIDQLHIPIAREAYLHFARIDQLDTLNEVEGIFFLATPDIIAGLSAWAFYDNNEADAVSCPFSSGCCSTVTLLINENRCNGRRTFLGMMDLSARPYIGPNELSFAIPFSRLKEMMTTLTECCLWEAPAWQKLKGRIVRPF